MVSGHTGVRVTRGSAARKQRTQVLIVCCLSVLLLVLVSRSFGWPVDVRDAKPAAAGNAVVTVAAETTPQEPSLPEIAWEQPRPIPPNLRDPMYLKISEPQDPAMPRKQTASGQELAPVEAVPPGEITLAGIVYSARERAVIIDGKQVHEGETIYGATVKRIDKHAVELERGGKSLIVSVQGDDS